jgi:hypothetical protein
MNALFIMTEEQKQHCIQLLRWGAGALMNVQAYDLVKEIREFLEEITGEPVVFDWED